MTNQGGTRPDADARRGATMDLGRRAAPWSAPPETEVLDLIRRADAHALGRTFLERGAQDAVAATFGVHAFLVDAARERLAASPE